MPAARARPGMFTGSWLSRKLTASLGFISMTEPKHWYWTAHTRAGAVSGEQRLLLACGLAPTGSLRLASLATSLETTTSTTLQMEVHVQGLHASPALSQQEHGCADSNSVQIRRTATAWLGVGSSCLEWFRQALLGCHPTSPVVQSLIVQSLGLRYKRTVRMGVQAWQGLGLHTLPKCCRCARAVAGSCTHAALSGMW